MSRDEPDDEPEMRLTVRVHPGARGDEVGGRYGTGEPPVLIVRVAAPARDGQANERLVARAGPRLRRAPECRDGGGGRPRSDQGRRGARRRSPTSSPTSWHDDWPHRARSPRSRFMPPVAPATPGFGSGPASTAILSPTSTRTQPTERLTRCRVARCSPPAAAQRLRRRPTWPPGGARRVVVPRGQREATGSWKVFRRRTRRRALVRSGHARRRERGCFGEPAQAVAGDERSTPWRGGQDVAGADAGRPAPRRIRSLVIASIVGIGTSSLRSGSGHRRSAPEDANTLPHRGPMIQGHRERIWRVAEMTIPTAPRGRGERARLRGRVGDRRDHRGQRRVHPGAPPAARRHRATVARGQPGRAARLSRRLTRGAELRGQRRSAGARRAGGAPGATRRCGWGSSSSGTRSCSSPRPTGSPVRSRKPR